MTYVRFDSWAGRTHHRVTVLKVGPKRSKVRFEEAAFWRSAGHVQYVPNSAIVGEPEEFFPRPHRHPGPVAGCPECAKERRSNSYGRK